ncbi:DUF397 domain-containing protein [Nonomuraea roseola]|uniref:DUF397 domain-containing protein n=1 Tax=Nonomuraea roseola TaxID=46179 RepID=A0ABV5PRM3_9ACTN
MSSPHELIWHACNNGDCVQVAKLDDRVLIRDSKSADGAVLRFSTQEWESFVEAVKRGRFDGI